MQNTIDRLIEAMEAKTQAAKQVRDIFARYPDLAQEFLGESVKLTPISTQNPTEYPTDHAEDQEYRDIDLNKSALDRVKDFFVATDNAWIPQPELRRRLNIKKGTASNIFYQHHAHLFEQRPKNDSPQLKEWRMKPDVFQAEMRQRQKRKPSGGS